MTFLFFSVGGKVGAVGQQFTSGGAESDVQFGKEVVVNCITDLYRCQNGKGGREK